MSNQLQPDKGNSTPKGKGFAIASLLLGVLNLLQAPLQLIGLQVNAGPLLGQIAVISILLCALLGIIGIVCGIISIIQARRNVGWSIRWLAVTAILINILSILATVSLLVVILFRVCGNCGLSALATNQISVVSKPSKYVWVTLI